LANLNIRDIDPAATAEAIASVAQVIGSLLAYPVVDTYKIDTDELDAAA
jgi:phosphoribosylformylglycinamidine (FGAM) synthase PurS component